MAAFTQSFTITQSADCETLTFQDTSNFSDNDEGYTYGTFTTKTITLFDQDNEVYLTPIDIVDDTPVDITLDKDRYFHIEYTLSNDDITLTKIMNLILTCFVEIKYGEFVLENDCGCGCEDENGSLCNVVKSLTAADIFARRGNGLKAQDALDLANSYIDCSN